MKLNQYPKKIAQLRQELLELELELESLTELVKSYEAEIEKTIAFDKELTNESQRKAKKVAMKADPTKDYYQLAQVLRKKREEREIKAIDLELIRNQFSLAKLEKRQEIAQLELNAQLA
jgi:hypothetical protein